MDTRRKDSAPVHLPQCYSGSSGRRSSAAEAGVRKGHFYRALPTELRHGGFTFRQIAREGDIPIYSQTWDGCDDLNVSPRFEQKEVDRIEKSPT